jgi:hypothetical protein
MGFLSKTFIKKELNTSLKSYVKKYGYTLQSYRGDLMVVKEKVNKLFTIPVYFSTYDDLILSQASIGYLVVEDILFKVIGLPFEYKEYPNIPTIKIIANDYSKRLSGKLKVEEDFDEIVGNFIEAFPTYYLPTFEKYSDPKNVLELWDSLDDKGKSNHFSSPHKNIKIMILSKMCNDEHYERRCQEAIDFYTMHYNNGIESAKGLIDDCYKVIKYLEENEI